MPEYFHEKQIVHDKSKKKVKCLSSSDLVLFLTSQNVENEIIKTVFFSFHCYYYPI